MRTRNSNKAYQFPRELDHYTVEKRVSFTGDFIITLWKVHCALLPLFSSYCGRNHNAGDGGENVFHGDDAGDGGENMLDTSDGGVNMLNADNAANGGGNMFNADNSGGNMLNDDNAGDGGKNMFNAKQKYV